MPFTFKKLSLVDVILVKPKIFYDDRGLFLEVYKQTDFKKYNILKNVIQVNQSVGRKNVLRGLHFQIKPYAQAKFIGVNQGKIYDVVVDLRKGSPTFGKWLGVNLDDKNKFLLYVPEGFAHGFCVVSKTATVSYFCNQVYSPKNEHGIIWNEPILSIKWPVSKPQLSLKDAQLPTFDNCLANFTYKKSKVKK